MKIIVFSKDRAMQLHLCLSSLYKYCEERSEMKVEVIFKATSYSHHDAYDALSYEFKDVAFIKEADFKSQLIYRLSTTKEVLFLVDDNIFVDEFSIKDIVGLLRKNERVLGFSLRLGRNTTICYPINTIQGLPHFYTVDDKFLMYRWVNADYDFAYPLEVSSSIYRVNDIEPIIKNCEYNSPNTLEAVLAMNSRNFYEKNPLLMCYEKSVAFCNPINKVQAFNNNRSGIKESYSPDALLKEFEKGNRISLEQFEGFVPTGAHEEVEIKLYEYNSISSNKQLL